jgi:anti-sigma regulatory factor (Ser/Thr protein kinase)
MSQPGLAHVDRFRHEALFYGDWTEFVSGTLPFIKDGIANGEPVLVVESLQKIDLLRTALGVDAEKVVFADMAQVGANPARIIPAWQDFVRQSGGEGKRLRGIGEPIWNGRTPDELVECQRHEGLLNVAFGHGQPWWLLCPYDTSQLHDEVLFEALCSHEYVMDARCHSQESRVFRGIEASGAPFDVALRDIASGSRLIAFDDASLLTLRRAVARFATSSGCSAGRATELVLAANEVATNSIVHGGGHGTLRMWRDGDMVIAEVRDAGRYLLPLGDRAKPGIASRDGRGLWLANNLCDLVQIRTLEDETVVRLHMKVDPHHGLKVLSSDSNGPNAVE